MIEQLMRWNPISNLSNKYNLESITDGMSGFKIVLSAYENENKKLQIIFEDSVDSYRCTDESLRLRTLQELHATNPEARNISWTLFKIHNSAYAQWLSEESYETTSPQQFQHFLLLTSNEVIDIVASYEPTVEHIASPA